MSRAAPSPIVARVKSLGRGATTSQIDEIAEAVRADLAAAEAEHKRLAGERRAVLLSGDDEAAAAHDGLIAAAARRQDRARLLLEDLMPRRKAASAREETSRLDARKAEAAATASALTAALSAEYAPHANAIAAFLARWKAGHALIEQTNDVLRIAGRTDCVVSPETALRSKPSRQMPDEIETREDWFLGGRPLRPVVLVKNSLTGKMQPAETGAERRKVQEVVAGAFIPAKHLPRLADAAHLPPALIDDAEPVWRGKPVIPAFNS